MTRRLTIATEVIFTDHALERCIDRNVTKEEVMYIIDHGRAFHNAGATAYALRWRDIPLRDRHNQRICKLTTAMILVGKSSFGTTIVITVERNNEALKKHLRKQKYNRCKLAA